MDNSKPHVQATDANDGPINSPIPEEVRGTFNYMPATLAGYVAGIAVVTMLFWQRAPRLSMLSWLGLFGLVLALRALVFYRYRQSGVTSLPQWLRWRLYSNIGSLSSGLMWGLAAWLFYKNGGDIQQTGLIVLIYTFCIAAVPVLSTQPRVYVAFAVLCFIPLVARIVMDGNIYSYQLAGLLLLIVSLTTVLARTYRQTLQRVIELKLQADRLLVQLRNEKEAADAARRDAEVANRAKTQFFTAASHDLRQPLHAMGLFAEALRQKSHDEEVAQLVNSINSSVDALEGLFSELLDIARIDSGGVDVHPTHFGVADIWQKLRLHFEPNAFEKGLSLRFRGDKHLVYADPLLVERIMRNLLSNAIRYTDDGTVLISARKRGDRILLQVWDTGQGIALHEQQHIFEEFYQLTSNRPAMAEQRKGLGLGLAIVKRLAALMNAPLQLVSNPGKGTVFSLEVPRGTRTSMQAPAPVSKGPLSITLDGRLIVIVEDEPSVLGGLEVLLKGWGAGLASFNNAAQAMTWAQTCESSQAAPDLLIVDYRLEGGKTGVQVIAAMRQRFGDNVPAVVVTGSTMSNLEQEALDHNFHLLTKPVVPNKLRAMIAFKLGAKPG